MTMTLDLKRMTHESESLVVCKTHPTILLIGWSSFPNQLLKLLNTIDLLVTKLRGCKKTPKIDPFRLITY